jgi:hypothetical protein
MENLNLAKITSELVGKPYRLGERKAAFDCTSLILEFASLSGMPIPEDWEGFTSKNYAKFYEKQPVEAMEVLACWITSIGKEIPAIHAFAGDILVMRLKRGHSPDLPRFFLGIHAGQDKIMAVTEKRGVTLIPIRDYEIIKAFRWREKKKPKLMNWRKMQKWMEE